MSNDPANPSARKGELRMNVEHRGPVAVVKLAGSAHMDVTSKLRDQLVGIVDEKTSDLVLDLADLDFINSVGLGAIIAAYLRCRRRNGGVKVVAPKPAIQEILTVTKLTSLFPVHPSVDAALASN
ncbi:MAG: STAS domain-containing protein [Phycisphaerae bacterium]|jgi:anti-sigma B factor antagonist